MCLCYCGLGVLGWGGVWAVGGYARSGRDEGAKPRIVVFLWVLRLSRGICTFEHVRCVFEHHLFLGAYLCVFVHILCIFMHC